MRGGTSKGVFFDYEDMPKDESLWEAFLLDVMGSPDARQIDGLGGANSLTSKVAIIKKSDREGIDVDYTFAQVSISDRLVDFKGNCGNISSAVGPYAIDKGLVPLEEPYTKVKIFNTNTKKLIVAEVEVENGSVKYEGDTYIPGAPIPGSAEYLSFFEPEGAVTGKTFPTGNSIDYIDTSFGNIGVSIIDVANPLVFIKAEDIGLKGTELPEDFNENLLTRLEEIRSIAAELCGFASRNEATKLSPAVPKTTIVAPSTDYIDSNGVRREKKDMDLLIRMMSMQKPHKALAITGAICATVGIHLKDTILYDLVPSKTNQVRLAHPAGIMETSISMKNEKLDYVKIVRTARKIMEGYVFTRGNY